jgi:hypothetical protein
VKAIGKIGCPGSGGSVPAIILELRSIMDLVKYQYHASGFENLVRIDHAVGPARHKKPGGRSRPVSLPAAAVQKEYCNPN